MPKGHTEKDMQEFQVNGQKYEGNQPQFWIT